jgi:hypothetical protein
MRKIMAFVETIAVYSENKEVKSVGFNNTNKEQLVMFPKQNSAAISHPKSPDLLLDGSSSHIRIE